MMGVAEFGHPCFFVNFRNTIMLHVRVKLLYPILLTSNTNYFFELAVVFVHYIAFEYAVPSLISDIKNE